MTAGAATMTDAVSPGAAAKYEEKEFGFWLYLMSDAVIFALLFATYLVMVGNTAAWSFGQGAVQLAARRR